MKLKKKKIQLAWLYNYIRIQVKNISFICREQKEEKEQTKETTPGAPLADCEEITPSLRSSISSVAFNDSFSMSSLSINSVNSL